MIGKKILLMILLGSLSSSWGTRQGFCDKVSNRLTLTTPLRHEIGIGSAGIAISFMLFWGMASSGGDELKEFVPAAATFTLLYGVARAGEQLIRDGFRQKNVK